MFNELATTAQAEERLARFRREAALKRFTPSSRQRFARFLKSVAAAVESRSTSEGAEGGRYVRTRSRL